MNYKVIIGLFFFFAFAKAYAQQLTGSQVIEKSIAYHDPSGAWSTFASEFTVTLEMPDAPTRKSVITLDFLKEYFNMTTLQDGVSSFKEVSRDTCRYTDDTGAVQSSATTSKACERAVLFKNYYTYLYGLPMKLRDPGTHIEEQVALKTFKGKEYLVVQVSYDASVGTDVWQFYFDPSSYAMEVYQFFKGTDERSGEYIMLSDIAQVHGIKMPKKRAWYYNKNDGYLGTDVLVKQ